MNIDAIEGSRMYPTQAALPAEKISPDQETGGRLVEEEPAPVYDRYIPGDAKPEGAPKPPKGKGPGQPASKAERCTADTSQVDREIERLREKTEQLEVQLARTEEGPDADALRKQLAQVQAELRQKDNDGYRRQHAVFS